MVDCLERFCAFSGQRVNVNKSHFYLSPNVNDTVKEEIRSISAMVPCQDLGLYLGVPIHTGRVTRRTYDHVIEKVKRRLAAWKTNQLSLAGRATLVQSVSSTIATYTMQSSKLPVAVTKEIDTLNRNFLWGSTAEAKKVPLVRWDNVCKPKRDGGLGIRKTADMNKALLAKLGWKLESGDQGLWARVLRSKYLKGTSFLNSSLKTTASHTWRGIYSSRNLVHRGCAKLVANGASTSFWFDRWLGPSSIAHTCNLAVPLHMQADVVRDYRHDGDWNWELLNSLPQEIQDSLSLVLLCDLQEDRLCWMASSDGNFSVSSAYKLLVAGGPKDSLWNKLWKMELPPRVKYFLWLLIQDRLLTKAACFKRNITPTNLCSRCGTSEEDVLHALRDCPSSQFTWKYWLHGHKLTHFNSLTLHEWLRYNLSLSNFLLADGVPWSVLFSFICWLHWKWRNQTIFEQGFSWPPDAPSRVWSYIREFRTHKHVTPLLPRRHLTLIAWTAPCWLCQVKCGCFCQVKSW